jgi:hypothetical protein
MSKQYRSPSPIQIESEEDDTSSEGYQNFENLNPLGTFNGCGNSFDEMDEIMTL